MEILALIVLFVAALLRCSTCESPVTSQNGRYNPQGTRSMSPLFPSGRRKVALLEPWNHGTFSGELSNVSTFKLSNGKSGNPTPRPSVATSFTTLRSLSYRHITRFSSVYETQNSGYCFTSGSIFFGNASKSSERCTSQAVANNRSLYKM